MNLTELQVELRDIEKHISQLHLEIENMKPKTDEEKKTDYDAITKLAKQYPITGLGISNASDIQKKQFVSSLSYLLLTEEKNVYARLLYLCRLSFGCNLKLVAEDIYTLGLEFESKDIDKVCMDLENYKYSYLIEAFVIANLSERLSTNILKIIADIAKVMGCDQEEIRVLAQIAKSKLMDDIDIVNHIPLPSRNRWSGKLNDYIPKSWIESQREKCIEICTEKYIKKSSSASSASLFLAMNMINKSGDKTYDVKKPCVVKARVEAGSVVKKGTTILEYEEEVMHQKATSTSRVASVTETSYEMFFYAYIDGNPVQCFELAEQELLDENELDTVFADIVDVIKKSKAYQNDKNNIATITVDKSGVKMDMEYVDKNARMYGVKKEWKQKNI